MTTQLGAGSSPARAPRTNRVRRTAGALTAVILVLGASATGAAAASKPLGPTPEGGPRPLAVSVPSEPTVISPGASASILMRVVNPGSAPVTVTVTGRALKFADNGKVTIRSKPDPAWAGLVDFPSAPFTIPAESYVDSPFTVTLPPRISPDLYFVGFLVTPVASDSANLQIVNQIGSFVTIDVPGPRVRKLRAQLDTAGFVVGSHVDGALHIQNVGHAAAQYWGENDTSSSPGGGTPKQHRIEKSLLPVGQSRMMRVTAEPAWPIGFVTMRVQLVYPGRTDVSTQEIVLSKRIFVISPLVIAAVVALLVLAVALFVRRRLRKTRVRHARGAARQPSASPRGTNPRGSNPRRTPRTTAVRPGRRHGIRRLTKPRPGPPHA
jgi:hypothetical protein